jgi:apolipoprotein D and lipocalin family protein
MNIRYLLSALAAVMVTGCASTSASKPPLKPVAHLDLPRYMGKWYVYANIPYSLENGKVGTYDNYALRPDGKIQNDYHFHPGTLDAPEKKWSGTATVFDKTTNAEWRIQFIWPLTSPYLVIGLDPNYQWSLIGYPSRDKLWVLTRSTHLSDSTYKAILAQAAAQGYDVSKVQRVLQK